MLTVERIHRYLHANARVRACDIVDLDVVTLYNGTVIDPTDNVVLANTDDADHLVGPLAQVRVRVNELGGLTHIRLAAEVFPQLAATIVELGFQEVKREPLLVCTPESLRPGSNVPGLTFVTLTSASPLRTIQQELDINERGFDPGFTDSITSERAERFRSALVTARAFIAHLNGEPVAAGMFHTPLDGVTQFSGIATLAAFRQRGIATALTTFMTRTSFDAGVDLVYLAAANEPARRIYERLGFREVGTLLVYEDATLR